MDTFSKNYEGHPERIGRLDEVKRRTIVDALDQHSGAVTMFSQRDYWAAYNHQTLLLQGKEPMNWPES
jgi:hypothetical protein